MSRKDKIQKRWEESLKLYSTAAAVTADAWALSQREIASLKAAAQSEISSLKAAEENYLWEIKRLRQFNEKSEEIRRKLIAENAELREENLSLRDELQERDNIIDRIASTNNQVLIAELFESEGA